MVGSEKKQHRHLPKRMRLKHGGYYHVVANRWTPLGREFGAALKKWAELEAAPEQVHTVGDALSAYLLSAVPRLAQATQKDYTRIVGALRAVFGDMPLGDMTGADVAQYLERRSAKVSANRAMAVLSSTYTYAMRMGWATANPCRTVRRNRESRRTRLPTAAEIASIRERGTPLLQAAIDLAMMTGLRKADLLGLDIASATDEGLEVRTQKTGTPLCIAWTSRLRQAVRAAQGGRDVGPLLVSARKRRLTPSGLDTLWDKARAAAGVEDLHWHDLRAWALTEADRTSGREAARALGGHRDASTTDRYLRDRSARLVQPVAIPRETIALSRDTARKKPR